MSDTPLTREELFYQAILNGQIPDIVPITRQEMYLAKIAAKIAAGYGSASGGEWVTEIDETITLENKTGFIQLSLSNNTPVKEFYLEVVLPITEQTIRFRPIINDVHVGYYNGMNSSTTSELYYYSYGNLEAQFILMATKGWAINNSSEAAKFMKPEPTEDFIQSERGMFELSVDAAFTGDIKILLKVKR